MTLRQARCVLQDSKGNVWKGLALSLSIIPEQERSRVKNYRSFSVDCDTLEREDVRLVRC